VQRRSALDSSGLPPALLQSTPRRVTVNTLGGMLMLIASGLVVIGIWGGIELTRSAETANRHVSLYGSERIVTAGEVTQLRRRGGDDDHRITAYYRYMARGRVLTGQTTLRRADHVQYEVGSQVAVWYLATEPEANWLDGYSPRPEVSWPGTVVPLACGVSAMALLFAVRRQSKLLTDGRPAMATITKVEKKGSDHGTTWLVHYSWTTISGATRTGKYHYEKKPAPAVGTMIPVVYDRDDTFRHGRYPMSFVRINGTP
jgi:hypothetical protein